MRPTEKAKSVGPHRPKAEPHWSKLGEKTSTAGIRILLFVAKYFGISKYTLYSYIDSKQQEGKTT